MNITVLHPETTASFPFPKISSPKFRSFVNWTTKQDIENHIGWVGISIISMTAVFFPLTMAIILFSGASVYLIGIAMVSLVAVVIVNLAALSTRYTIPFLISGILMDVIAVMISLL